MAHVQRKHLVRNGLPKLLIFVYLSGFCCLSIFCGSTGLAQTVEQADSTFPEVRVTNVRRVFHNGEHNAFTDLIRFEWSVLFDLSQLS